MSNLLSGYGGQLKTIAMCKSYVGITDGAEQASNENAPAFREVKVQLFCIDLSDTRKGI